MTSAPALSRFCSAPARAVIELQRPAGADGTVEQARVRADPAGVELLRVERAEEAVDADRQTGGESRPPIQRDEMESRVEEVAGRVVLPSIGAQRRLREGARLLQAIDLELVGERCTGAFLSHAKLAEGTDAVSRAADPPALVGEFAQGKISVQRPERPGNEPPDLLIFPAASFDLHAGFRLTAAAPREDVDRSTERVAAEDRGRAANDLDAFDVRERDQLEGDLFGRRFVHPHAVDEHADPLRQAGDRARGGPPQRKILLPGVSLLIGEMDPGNPLQGLLERPRAAGADFARIDHLHRESVRGGPALRQPGRPEHRDLLAQSVLVARTALRRGGGLLPLGPRGMRAQADHQVANQRQEGRSDDPVHAALEFAPGKLAKVALQQERKQAGRAEVPTFALCRPGRPVAPVSSRNALAGHGDGDVALDARSPFPWASRRLLAPLDHRCPSARALSQRQFVATLTCRTHTLERRHSMKLFALSILGLALAVPAARAPNQDTNDTSKATAQQGTDATTSTAQQGTDATRPPAAQVTDATKSTAQTSDTGKASAMDRKAKDRPAAARSHDLGKSDDECMCDCNGKMTKGNKSHPMGRG